MACKGISFKLQTYSIKSTHTSSFFGLFQHSCNKTVCSCECLPSIFSSRQHQVEVLHFLLKKMDLKSRSS